MAQSYVFPLLSVLVLFNVYKCRGSGPKSCDESGFPVCATNGTHWYFFKNMCLLNSENHERESFNVPTLRPTDVSNCFNNCDQRCSNEFSPICATTQNVQKTFPNKCEFDLENCKSGNIWKFLYIGKCDKSRPLNPHPHVYPTQTQRRHLQPFSIPQSNTKLNPINLPDHRGLQQQHQYQEVHPTSPITPVPQLDKISFPHIQFNQNPNIQGQHHLEGQNNPHNTQLAHLGQPVQHQLSISIPQQFSHPQNKPHVHQNIPIPALSPKPISQVQLDPHFHSQQHPQPAVQPGAFHEPNESPLVVQPQQQFHSQPQNPGLNENPIQHQNIQPHSNPQKKPQQNPQLFEQTNLQPQVQNQPVETPISQPHVRPHHHSLEQHPQPPIVQSESVSPIVVPHAQAHPHSHSWQHPQPQIPWLNKSPIPQPHFIPQEKPHSYLHKQPQQAHLRPEVFQVLQHDQPHSESYPQEGLRPQISWLNEDKIPHFNTQEIQNPPIFQQTHLQPQDQSLSIENPSDYPISQPHADQHYNSQQYLDLESPVDHVTVPEVIGNPIELQQAQPDPEPQTYIHQHSQPQNVEQHLNSQDIPHSQLFQQDRLQSQVQSLPTLNPSDYTNSKQHVEPQHHFQQYPPHSPIHHEAFPELDKSHIFVPHAQPQPQLQFQQHSQPQISWPDENPISQQHFQTHSNPQEESHSQIFQQTQLQPQVQSPPNEKFNDYSISQPHVEQHHNFQQYLQSPVHPQTIPEVIKNPIELQNAQPHPQRETYITQQSQPQNPGINEHPISQQHVEHHLNSQDLPHTQQDHLQSQVQSLPIKSPIDYHISQQHVEPHYHYQHYPPQSVVHPEAFPQLDESPFAVPHTQPQPQLHFQQHSQPQIPRVHKNRISQQHFQSHSNPQQESHPQVFQQTQLQLRVNSLPIDKSNDYPIFQPHAVQHHNSQQYLQSVYPVNVPKLTKRPIDLQRAQPHPQIQSKNPRQFLRRWHNYKTLRQFRPFQRRRQYPKRTSNNTPIPGRRYQQIQLPQFQRRSHLNVRPQSHLNRQAHSQRYPISQPNIQSRPMSHYRPNVYDRPLKHYLKHAHPLKYSYLRRSQKLPVPSPQPNIRPISQNANNQILPDFQPQSRSNPHSNINPTSPPFTTHPQDFQLNTFLIPQTDIQQPFRPGFKDLPNPQVTTIPQPRQQPQQQFSESEHMQQPLMIKSQCPTHCSLEYDPVCATFEDVEHTFDNSCYMKADICGSKRAWVLKHNGECIESESEGCNANCPRIYSPICATFNGQNRTFNNECLLDLEVCSTGNPWDYLYNGECRKSNRNCPTICPSIFSPVCASYNGIQREFPNQCFVLIEACRTKEDWKIVYQGKCGEETVPEFPQISNEQSTTSEQVHPTPSQQPTQLACPLCSDSYKPVCGVFNGQQQTFNNECLLLSENCYSSAKWTVAHEGECQAVAAPDPAARNCPNFCPLNYEPVCATFDGIRRTFPNECELNHEAYVTNKQWVILNVGECDYCPDCPNDISPVCAELGGQTRTFDNACKLEAENCRTNSAWKIVSKNSCGIRNCLINCPNIYIPICGISNGEVRTFGNICEMRQEACNTNTAWNIASKGECPRPNENCPQSCSLQYNPVCAVYQGVTKEFINECFLRSESCKTHKNWEFVNAGQCADQNQHHSQDSTPGTVGTPTQMADPKLNCQINKCLAFRDPVCATLSGEERTFLNSCYLSNVKCKTGEDWKIIKHGSCGKSSSSPPGSRILPKLIH